MPVRMLTYNGKTQSIPAWSRETGIPDGTIRDRIDRLGWSVEEALTCKPDERFRAGAASTSRVRAVPELREDERGRAVARWMDGGTRRLRTFGRWGTREARQAYERFAAEWYAGGGRVAADPDRLVSVATLIERCLAWAEQTFVKHGRITSEVHGYRAALGTVNDLYGATPANEFGPVQLRAVVNRWIGEGKAISTVNNYLSKVQICWSRGVGDGSIPAAVADALRHVERAVAGRTAARPKRKVRSAPAKSVEAVLAQAERLDPDPGRRAVLVAMVRLQLATGMRPGEVIELTPESIDRTRTPWLYAPASGGKTLHHDKPRRVYVGPKGREILAPWLDQAGPGQRVFRFARQRGGGTMGVPIAYYRDAIAAACVAAGVEVFTPHQLRHSHGTAVHLRYEDDAAVAAALGNSAEVARQVYVDDPSDAVARRIAEEMG